MIINECVIDAELFKKTSSDDKCSALHQLLESKLTKREFDITDIEECFCFMDLLKAIEKHHCKLGMSKKIMDKYMAFIMKCPNEIQIKFSFIISQQECLKNIDEELDYKEKEPFKGTSLEQKLPYITVAHFLEPRIIISSKKDIKDNYTLCSEKLFSFKVNCIDACCGKHKVIFK